MNFAFGAFALAWIVYGQYDIAIGERAGMNVINGSCIIIVGDGIGAPSSDTSFYINIDGQAYPNSARSERWFQALVRRRAHDKINELMTDDSPTVLHFGPSARTDAHKSVEEMSFFETECLK